MGFMINRLETLEKRLYQIIISRLDGDRIHSQEYQNKIFELIQKGICGFVIFGGERGGIKDFIARLQSLSSIPLFIASDIERGVGQQVKGCTIFPCQMAISAAINRVKSEDVDMLRGTIKAATDEVIDVGINLPLIPVLDVNQNPENPIVCTRAFSDDPLDVSWFGVEYIKGLERAGLLSCAKHFPGHGSTSADSHIELPEINKSLRELMDTDILPFRNAIKAGVSTIMVGHLHVSALDSMPASLSGKVIKDILREELGFKGLVLTDALNMSALSGMDIIPARCVEAGVDILLHPADAGQTVKELTAAIKSGMIHEENIDASIERISKAKARISKEMLEDNRRGDIDYNDHMALSESISERSITLVRRKEGILPVKKEGRFPVFVAGEAKLFEASLWKDYFKEIFAESSHAGDGLVYNYENYFEGHSNSDVTAIIAVFSGPRAWKGISGIDDNEGREILKIINKAHNSIVISFGSPYILRCFKDADILIAAYDSNEYVQKAVIKCLYGELDFKGRMPVRIELSA